MARVNLGGARSAAYRPLKTALGALLLIAGLARAAGAADPPPLLPIQGYLADAVGNAVSGTHALRFSIYPSDTSATAIYVEDDAGVAVTAGSFVVYLGAATPLPLALFRDNAQLWLEVVVDGTEVIQPRARIATAPYAGSAQYCGDATTLGGSPASAFAQASHTHAFASLTGVPSGLADGDNDLLASLSCANGQVAKFTGGAWACAADADADTLAGIACVAGQFVQHGAGSAWMCSSLATVATTGSFGDLAGVPPGIVTSSRGTPGYLPRYASDTALTASNVVQDDAGNIGIGIGRPGAPLHVNGVIRFGANLLTPAGVIQIGDTAGELHIAANTLRMTETTASAGNVVLGFSGNALAAGVVGAAISGGGGADSFGNTGTNQVESDFGTIGGGFANVAGRAGQLYREASTVGGGQFNIASGAASTVAGGTSNVAGEDTATVGGGSGNQAQMAAATVGGGSNNVAGNQNSLVAGGNGNTASGYTAAIGGGESNNVSGGTSVVGGGIFNIVAGDSAVIAGGASNKAGGTYAAVAGGANNVASGQYAASGGGNANTAAGMAATIPGGWLNTAAGGYSFAAGYRAKANQPGCFTWGDSQLFDVACNTTNAWVARSTGGVSFITGVNAGSGAATAGVSVAAGSGTWAALSDRNAKRDIQPVDGRAVLAALERVPVSTWSYRAEVSGARHMGPMAQDFKAAFDLGDSDKQITTIDADGVALAAVAGLHTVDKEHDARLAELARQNATLARENAEIRARLERLERRLAPVAVTGSQFGFGLGAAGMGLAGFGMVVVRRRRTRDS